MVIVISSLIGVGPLMYGISALVLGYSALLLRVWPTDQRHLHHPLIQNLGAHSYRVETCAETKTHSDLYVHYSLRNSLLEGQNYNAFLEHTGQNFNLLDME